MDLKKVGPVIKAAMLLHNFLVDEREQDSVLAAEDHHYFTSFNAQRMVEEDDSLDPHSETRRALVTDNDAHRPSGRPSNSELQSRERGEEVRNNLARDLANAGLQRPKNRNWTRNEYGHVYAK